MRDDMHFLSSEQVRAITDQPTPHKVAASEVVWSGRIVDMVEDRVVVVEGEEPVVRQYTRHPGAVAVVGIRASLWEIPAGLLDIPGEDPLVAAERELAEEADLSAERWNTLVDFYTSPGGSTEPIRVFLARDLAPTGTTFEREDEEATMEYAWVSLTDAMEWVLAGRLHNPSTVIGIMAAHAARGRGWQGLREPGVPWLR